jgi:hypothetical protein
VEVGRDHYGLYFGIIQPTRKDFIWVVVDRFTKSAHFIPIKVRDPMDKLVRLYVQNIVLIEGVNLGFGSLRALEGQFRLLGRRTLSLVDVCYL